VDLSAFIESQVKGLRLEKGDRAPRPATCLHVKKVASRSIASRAGIAAGDLLSLVDGSPASRQSPRLYDDRAKKRLLSFYSRARQESVELATTGIEIGIELDQTAEGIKARFKPNEADSMALERLWELGDCATLLELSRAVLALKGGDDTPALLFEGVGLWEAGQYEPGLERVKAYLTRISKNWTMNFTSIGGHYLGLEELRQGRKQAGLERLQRGFDYFPLESTADVIAEITGIRPPMKTPRWSGKPFPVQYALPTIEGEKKTVGLADAVQGMQRGKLLVVCLLANYRSNGPYYDLLNRFHNYATHFAPFLEGVHVLTTEATRYPHRAYHYEREDELRALPLPFEVMLEEGDVVGTIEPTGSPFVLLVDHQGTIRYDLFYGSNRFLVGRSELTWDIAGGRYRLATSGKTIGLAALFYPFGMSSGSEGRVTESGFQPDLFFVDRTTLRVDTTIAMPSASRRLRTAPATSTAVGSSPCTQTVSTFTLMVLPWRDTTSPSRTMRTTWSAALAGSLRTVPGIEREARLPSSSYWRSAKPSRASLKPSLSAAVSIFEPASAT
jgi:hypothetical protein